MPIAHFIVDDNQTGALAGIWDAYSQVDMYNLWFVSESKHVFYFCPVLMGLLVITTALAFIDIWLFKHRALQMRLATFCMILLVFWYIAFGIIVFYSSPLTLFRPHWTAALPAAALILLYLAFRGILKDEMLVRSLDRLR
jgi:glucan phosphoethanolaminetransferase (alkaline phosphatase superfamily)